MQRFLRLGLLPSWFVLACSDGDPSGAPDAQSAADAAPDAATPGDAGVTDTGASDAEPPDATSPNLGAEIFLTDCVACHTLGRGDQRGPDLAGVTDRRPRDWLRRWLADPAATAAETPYGAQIVAEWGVLMPNSYLDATEIEAVIDYMAAQSAAGPLQPSAPVELSTPDFERMRQRYFGLCAGCHGTLRLGATGPKIDQATALALGTDALVAILRNGRPWGMPAFGLTGTLDETALQEMAAFLQRPVPPGPDFTLANATASWELIVPLESRPTAPEHTRDWENFFGVVLRDTAKVALFDGSTGEELARIDVGFAVHILRASSTGRYFYAIGRDGWITLIDLWAATPAPVARVRGCHDARSVEGSKAAGFEDRYVIEGCYAPSQYVVFDGLTLEPLAMHSTLGNAVDTQEPLNEVRVASIIGLHDTPAWAVSLKESGHVVIVDYTDPTFPINKRIEAERFLHDGGLDGTGRYFLVAANSRNRMVVVDLETQSLVTTFETGALPHPGRGANWVDPEYGPVNATVHIGEPKLAVYGVDPVNRPENAWRVVREIALPSSGSLFLKTHPNSPWVVMDMTLSTDPSLSRQICAYSKAEGRLDRCFSAASRGAAVHPEFDRTGTELWVSGWDADGELIIYDAVTLEEKRRVGGLPTPTGKFNVFNTAHDVY